MYYVWAGLLVLANACAVGITLFTLPGNWLIVAFTALFVWAIGAVEMGWTTVVILVVLAVVGEIVEVAAGAAGAAREGASRRAMLLSLIGTVVGSMIGAAIGVPIPVIGLIIGAVGGGALGAFAGAWMGEQWKGTTTEQGVRIGRAAMIGRVLGTAGKLMVGAIMFVVAAVNAFV